MQVSLQDIRDELGTFHLPSALAFINHVLTVSRGERKDPRLAIRMQELPYPLPVFVCRFLAKQFLLSSSSLGPYRLDWHRLRRLFDMYFDLGDPILTDPGWPDADPSGFFERFLSQQLPPQNLKEMREYGLAFSLFGDSTPGFDLRGECERVLGVSLDKHMQFGFLCAAVTSAARKGGVLTHDYLRQAQAVGIDFAVPEVWEPFLNRVACTPERFREVSRNPAFKLPDDRYATTEFNPLLLHPLIELSPGRFVAPDPRLLVVRTTWGLFHDLFGACGVEFSEQFGEPFSRLVGRLLKSVCPVDALWTDNHSRETAGRRGDWAFVGPERTVLIECKSARPRLELTSMASEASVEYAATRVAEALEQLMDHDAAIQRGDWRSQALQPGPTVHLVVTFGQFTTVNGAFFRKRMERALAARGRMPTAPYVILGIQEFDAVIKLVELGERLDEVILHLSSGSTFNPLDRYHSKLQIDMISSFARNQAESLLGFIDHLRVA